MSSASSSARAPTPPPAATGASPGSPRPTPEAPAKPAPKPKAERKPKPITPEQALANTRALLEAKKERAHQPPSYPTADPVHPGKPGFMSEAAAATFNEHHMEEANSPAIHGHIAANDRSAQVKRDKE